MQRAADVELVVEHEDGTTSRFREKDIMDAFLHEYGRGGRHFDGEEPGEAHPVVVALRTATNLDSLMSEQGTIVGHMLGEDEIIRGLRERPGAAREAGASGRVERGGDGMRMVRDSYEHWRETDHDDLVLAAALACWWARRRRDLKVQNKPPGWQVEGVR